jgi:hypothetical protein
MFLLPYASPCFIPYMICHILALRPQRSSSLGSAWHPFLLKGRTPHLIGGTRLWRTVENLQRVPDFNLSSYRYRAFPPPTTPTHISPTTNSCDAQRTPRHFRTQRPSHLHACFLRQDAIRKALDPPYTGPYPVLSPREKTLRILGQTSLHNRQGRRHSSLHYPCNSTSGYTFPFHYTEYSSSHYAIRWHVHFPDHYLHCDSFSEEGWGGMSDTPTWMVVRIS